MPDATYVCDAFSRIADRYVLTNHVLSCGMDIWWRKVVAERIRGWNPARLLDIASGTGDLALEIQRQSPECEVIASDFCADMLEHASRRGVRQTLVADALQLPFEDGQFDCATVAFGLRNMADYPAALKEMLRVIRPGGHLLILDFSLPSGLMRMPYRLYLHQVLPRLAGRLTGHADTYEYLGGSIEAFPSGEGMCSLLQESGFTSPRHRPLTGGIVSIYEASHPTQDEASHPDP